MFSNARKMTKIFLQFLCKLWYYVTNKINRKVSKVAATAESAVFGEVDSIDFAIYLNQKAHEFKIPVNVTKIQKWLYICYGLYFAINGEQLLTERPKAWDFGPAFPRVHNKQRKNNGSLDNLAMKTSVIELSKYDAVIRATLDNFGDWNASELVAWTHEPGRAWHKTFVLLDAKYAPMDNNDIMIDFRSIVSNV